ncbi:uncharacterized protein LOC135100404 isoform X2 [Scylla paramamosain]|uniref:uncharacterized protein LOC135100404 isoform X2 n=1 Tax=Scylla paramamosain TaxID=85552 RepID=UPI003083418A
MIPGQCASLCLHPHATMRSHLFVPLVNPFVPKPHGVYVVLQERQPRVRDISAGRSRTKQREVFHAPFCTTWFCTAWTGLFCPLCLACHSCFQRDKDSLKVSLKTIAQNFRDRGVTFKVRSCSSICSSSSSSMAEQRPGVGGRRQCARQVCHHGEPK